MDGVHSNLETEVAQLRKEVAECRAIIKNIWDYISRKGEAINELSQLSIKSISLLHYPLVPTFRGSASAGGEITMAAASSPIVAPSNVSSTSSGVPIGTLMLDSPRTRVAALPVVCPSPIGWERTQVHGASGLTLFHSNTDIVCLFLLQRLDHCCVACPSKVWPLGSHDPTHPV